jgi:general stress protein CsbA
MRVFISKLIICFFPALLLLCCAFENWPALILTVLLIFAAEHEIETEEIP